MSFNDKVVLVTGSSQGIGAAIAIRFAEEGAKVVIVGRNEQKLAEVAAQCKKHLTVAADVSKEDECKKVVDETVARFGQIDVLVNNAGIFKIAKITDPKALSVFEDVMNTNFRSTVAITHYAAPYLIKTKGSIINISAVASLMLKSGAGSFSYASSKAAMDHFGRCVALDLAPHGVRVNNVNPGPVKTEIISNAGMTKPNDDGPWETMRHMTALKRVSDPFEVADLTVFLASDKARSITGATIVQDNGSLLVGGALSHD